MAVEVTHCFNLLCNEAAVGSKSGFKLNFMLSKPNDLSFFWMKLRMSRDRVIFLLPVDYYIMELKCRRE